jgi:hypothetical protein
VILDKPNHLQHQSIEYTNITSVNSEANIDTEIRQKSVYNLTNSPDVVTMLAACLSVDPITFHFSNTKHPA